MAPPPGSSASNTVPVSQYIHLAPSDARHSFSRDEVRRLVLDYLVNSCYVDSAKAFAEEVDFLDRSVDEGIVRGDEASGKEGQVASGHESESESVDGTTNGRHKDNREFVYDRSRNDSAMEGVEATPEPASRSYNDVNEGDWATGDHINSKGSRTTSNGRGKKVMFESTQEDEPGDSFDTILLSRHRLKEARHRRQIQDDILNGRIQSAVELLQKHFPQLLNDLPRRDTRDRLPALPLSTVRPDQQCMPEAYFRPSHGATVNDLANAASNSANPPVLGAEFGLWSLSLDSSIVWLNLRLQLFVELMRTAHASASTPSTPTRMSDSMLSADSGAGMSASTSSLSSMSASVMNTAITQSQALRAEVFALPPGPIRERWERECIDVAGLLAYKDLTTCPVRGYLAQERRDTLAELVNAAILRREGHTPMPLLSLAAAQCTATWDTLAEWKLQFPPTSSSANGNNNNSMQQGSGSKGATATKGLNKTYPIFRLSALLRSQESMNEGPGRTAEANGARGT